MIGERGVPAIHVTAPFPEEPVHEPTNLFREPITARPLVQQLDELQQKDSGDHYVVQLANFAQLAMTYVAIKVGDRHPSHFHAEGPHAIFVLSGTGIIRIADDEYPMKPGTFALVPQATPHYARNTGSDLLRYVQLITPQRT